MEESEETDEQPEKILIKVESETHSDSSEVKKPISRKGKPNVKSEAVQEQVNVFGNEYLRIDD